jgi:hypothetical protein
MSNRLLAVVLIAAVTVSACRKSDAERAAAERAALAEDMRKSYALTPYRLLKLMVRSESAPDAPPELAELVAQGARIGELARKGEVRSDAEAVLRLAALTYRTRALLDRHDEDDFPLLWTRFADAPPAPWYDPGAEHLGLAFLLGVMQATASSGNDTSLLTFAAYELSRAEPKPDWPAPERLLARLERGVLFCGNHRHYAAEEELSAYLAELDAPAARALLQTVPGQTEPFLMLRGVGRLARGWNRLQLDRDEQGLEDLDGGLADLRSAGVENELTLWLWAVVHARRGRPAEAARALEQLAQSPYLGADARAEVQGCAASLRSPGKLPGMLLEGRALLLVGRALLARWGGVEKLVATVAGPDAARRLVTPVTALAVLQQKVALASDPGRLAAQAGALGSKLLDRVKTTVGGDGGAQGGAKAP